MVPIPFDEPFVIKGPIPENCYRIDFSYNIDPLDKNFNKKWVSFKGGSDIWTKDNNEEYAVICRGMHPNVNYNLKFQIYRNPKIDDKLKNNLKNKLSNALISFANKFKQMSFSEDDLEELNKVFERIILDELQVSCQGCELRAKSNPNEKYLIDIRKNKLLKPEFDKFRTSIENYFEATNELDEGSQQLKTLELEFKTINEEIIQDLTKALEDKQTLTKLSKEALELPFAPALEGYQNYTLRQGLQLLKNLITPRTNLDGLLNGKLKIKNTSVEITTDIDYQSIYFLESLLVYLSSGVLKDSTSRTLFQAIDSQITENESQTFVNVMKNYRNIELAKKNLQKFIEGFPDLTTEIVFADAVSLEAVPLPLVVSEKSPYVSVEAGVSFSTSFESVIRYTGANFYLSPINKNSPLSNFKGWNLFKKMFCFNVSVANFFGSRPINTFSILGESANQDLLLGIGLRLGRVVKLNTHWLPYKTNNENPFRKDRIIKGDLLFSIGADIDLFKALGKLGSALNLIN